MKIAKLHFVNKYSKKTWEKHWLKYWALENPFAWSFDDDRGYGVPDMMVMSKSQMEAYKALMKGQAK